MDFIIPGVAIRKTVVKSPSLKANAGTLENVQGRNSAARGGKHEGADGGPSAEGKRIPATLTRFAPVDTPEQRQARAGSQVTWLSGWCSFQAVLPHP